MDLSSLEGPPIPITRLSDSPSPPISPFNDHDLATQDIPRIQLDLNLPADITWDLNPITTPNPTKHTYQPPPTQQQSTPSWSGVETLWETTYSRPSSRNGLHNDSDDSSHHPSQRTLSPAAGAGASSRPSHSHSRSESSAHQQLVWLDDENIWVFVNSAPASPVSRPCWASHPTLAHSRSMESTTSSASSSTTPAHMNAVDRTPRLRDSAVLDAPDMSLPAALLLPPPPPPYERHIYDRPLPPLPQEAGAAGSGGGGGREGRRGSRWAAVARRINRAD
ncbi:hypothetical protein BDW42DRAFT_105685 [Aspergillus taichungensis]|uniref:Uncharacterized protein n=1 Tax=Aspergillus taichungensis TaxID=482145 RepID=A0A2J5HUF2_9EURO|nr:hypothetical protein BDW42DRAFT_105685 [Aspergillus taichungensis]